MTFKASTTRPINWRNGLIEMFANMFFVFIATMVLSLMVSSGNENNLTTQALIIGGVYATILFVFQSAWVDMNPVLSIFKVFKGARTWGESLYRISMQLLGAILAGVLVGYIFGGDLVAVAQYSDELAAGPKIMVYEFVGTALFFMIIMRVSCLKPNVHTLLTGFGVAIAIITTFPFNGGLTISPLWALGSSLGAKLSGDFGILSFNGYFYLFAGSMLVLPVAAFCHYKITLGGNKMWDDVE